MSKRILVIGGLAAGPSAASKAVRASTDVEVVMFEQGEHISYGICEIPYYIAGEVKEEGLVVYTPAKLKETKGVDARILHKVEEIQPTRKHIIVRDLKSGKTTVEKYDRLIAATGSRPRALGIVGEDSRNVFHVKSLEQGLQIRKYIDEEKPKRAVIVGGGYVGMEMADALCSRKIEVTMLHRHALPMAGLERETREVVRAQLEKHGVTFVGMARTEGFVVDKQQRVSHVVTSEGSYEADLVILSIGVVPNSGLAKDAGIRLGTSNGILTDQRQQTNLDNVYAAGDCCEVKNLVNNKFMYIPLATIASKAGWVAGENAAGGNATFRGAIRAIGVRVFDLEVVQVGISLDEAIASGFDAVTETISAWNKVAVMPGSKRVTIKTIADKKTRRLLGANLYGEEGASLRAHALAVAIQHRITIDEMQQWDLAYTPPFAPLWDPILVAANATRKKL
jgi:NADPH-dependent 2,4-dienoyl-CoA reductase/sulfur reductase-like enzyme